MGVVNCVVRRLQRVSHHLKCQSRDCIQNDGHFAVGVSRRPANACLVGMAKMHNVDARFAVAGLDLVSFCRTL